ncbi:MAG TPA: hypothetical protein DCE44_00755, partial [Verrucomicrobiales bacterium]|nr:hypothetical protein [Verrucomicrobiales bacterium]
LIVLEAVGRESRIELQNLESFVGSGLNAKAEGTLLTPKLTEVEGPMTLADGGHIDMANLTRLRNSSLSIDDASADFQSLVTMDSVSVTVASDGKATFPLISELQSPGPYSVSGIGSLLAFPILSAVSSTSGRFEARDFGALALGDNTEVLRILGGSITLSGDSRLSTKTLILGTNASFSGGGTLNGSIEVKGVIRVPNPREPLEINGDYTQTSDSTLELAILATRPLSAPLRIHGNATFNGKLAQTRVDNFVAQSGQIYRIITYGSRLSSFLSFNVLNAGEGLQFEPDYGSDNLSFHVGTPGPFFGIDYVLAADNREFDGQDIVVGAGTLVVEGMHQFRTLTLLGAVTCPAFQPSDGTGGRLDLEIEQDLTIHARGRLHADGKGFPERSGLGAPPPSSERSAGAGHGGWGGVSARGDLGGPPYGSLVNPVEMGSGGGAADAIGGGVVRVKVSGVLHVNGTLSADGGGTVAGGSGGSVLIEANSLTGSGSITANGGNSTSAHGNGAGGGGRVAVIAASIEDFDTRNIKAAAGKSDVDFCDGEPGTVFFSVGGKESINATELTLDGEPYPGSLAPNSQQYFMVRVPEGQTIRLRLNHGSDAAASELYASFDHPPSLSQSEFASGETGKPDQTLVIPGTRAGTYYVLARVASGNIDQREFSLEAQTLPFQVSGVEPRTVGTQTATVRVTGAGFEADTRFKLWREETGASVEPLNAIVQDATRARVTFDLREVPPAEYVLVATSRTGEVRAPDPIRLEQSSVVKAIVVFTPHPGLRRGRPGPSELLIQNTGDVDIEMARIALTCENHPDLSFSIPSLNIGGFQRAGDTQVAKFNLALIAPGEKVVIPVIAIVGSGYGGGALSVGYDCCFTSGSFEFCQDSGTALISSPRAFDPNIKIGPAGSSEAHWVSAPNTLPYAVLFENLPTAEAPAAEVFVDDFIDPSLDLTTFRLGNIQIGAMTVDVPAGRASFRGRVDLRATRGVYVDIEAGLDGVTRKAYWKFTSIDPETGVLPESALVGFLPPNGPTGAGEGMVQYSISPLPLIPSGTVITNQASIVFDVNAPILTGVVTNTIDSVAPTSVVTLVPDESGMANRVKLSATAADLDGSGVREILAYVSDGSGPFQLWGPLGSEAETFEGLPGHRYRIYSLAVDQVGNEEAIPDQPDLEVVFPPALQITYDAARGKVLLTWPGSVEGYSVQKSATIAGAFSDLLAPASRVGADWLVEADVSELEAYFRLHKSE